MKQLKRWISCLLICCMVVSVLPLTALAESTDSDDAMETISQIESTEATETTNASESTEATEKMNSAESTEEIDSGKKTETAVDSDYDDGTAVTVNSTESTDSIESDIQTFSVEDDPLFVDLLEISASDRYTGNQGDSFIDKIGRRNSSVGVSGTNYEHGLEAWIARWNFQNEISWAWAEYQISTENNGYNYLLGTIDVSSTCYNQTSYNTTIQILGDGNIIFEQTVTPETTYPIGFAIDVQGVRILKIYAFDNTAYKGGTSFLLGNLRLSNSLADCTHTWDEGIVTKEPTCVEPGENTHTCVLCGKVDVLELPSLGHDYVNGICSRCGAELIPIDDDACQLSEITSIDYLAFSSLSYTPLDDVLKVMADLHVAMITVKQLLGNQWDSSWEGTEIKNSELFSHVANWKIYGCKENNASGFGAYTFTNGMDEFVIAYRGSTKLTLDSFFNDPDWLPNDIRMFVGGDASQASEAVEYAESIVQMYGSESVHFTGHSLGGGLCDIVSARYGCYAESFNAAPFLMVGYYYYPEQMGEQFSGVESWQFIDHITDGDTWVGERGKDMKNYHIHKRNEKHNVKAHALASMVEKKDENGDVILTESLAKQRMINYLSRNLSNLRLSPAVLVFGTMQSEYVSDLLRGNSPVDTAAYLGNGDDDVFSAIGNDILVGGRGNDSLAGHLGNDNYYYFKGDGVDIICDVGGNDELFLVGFDENDEISVEADTKYIYILCNGAKIIWITRERLNNSDTFTLYIQKGMNGSTKINISDKFNKRPFWHLWRIACPVDIQIINDNTAEVVYTLQNVENNIGTHYTEYGYLYMYPDENGELIKFGDLFDGYSARIVGVDTGVMDVSVFEPEENSTIALSAVNIPVTKSMVATLEDDEETMKTYLVIDYDGDGITDDRIQLAEAYQISFNPNGGTGTMDNLAITVGEELTLPQCTLTPPEGQHFRAWRIGNTEYEVGDSYIPKADTQIYAVWEAHTGGVATCTEHGKCSFCGQEYGDLANHSYKSEWNQGNENGHWHDCENCAEHSEPEAHTPNTSDDTGGTSRYCTVCGRVLKQTPGHIHQLTKVERYRETCSKDGMKVHYTCTCGLWFEDETATIVIANHDSVRIPALGHDLSTATCTERAVCRRNGCDYSEGTALGHDWQTATCTTPKTCRRCGETEGVAPGHSESKWKHDKRSHWKVCTNAGCGITIEGTPGKHTDADGNRKCDVCGRRIPVYDSTNSATGDTSHIVLWLVVMVISASALTVLILIMRKKKKSNK